MDKRKSLISSCSSPPASPTIIPRLRAIQCKELNVVLNLGNVQSVSLVRCQDSISRTGLLKKVPKMFALCLACIHLERKMECLSDGEGITTFGAKTMLTQVCEILLTSIKNRFLRCTS